VNINKNTHERGSKSKSTRTFDNFAFRVGLCGLDGTFDFWIWVEEFKAILVATPCIEVPHSQIFKGNDSARCRVLSEGEEKKKGGVFQ